MPVLLIGIGRVIKVMNNKKISRIRCRNSVTERRHLDTQCEKSGRDLSSASLIRKLQPGPELFDIQGDGAVTENIHDIPVRIVIRVFDSRRQMLGQGSCRLQVDFCAVVIVEIVGGEVVINRRQSEPGYRAAGGEVPVMDTIGGRDQKTVRPTPGGMEGGERGS